MFRHKGFPGGLILPNDKVLSEGLAIQDIRASSSVQVALDDGAGGSAEATIQAGQMVSPGQCIGAESGLVAFVGCGSNLRELPSVQRRTDAGGLLPGRRYGDSANTTERSDYLRRGRRDANHRGSAIRRLSNGSAGSLQRPAGNEHSYAID